MTDVNLVAKQAEANRVIDSLGGTASTARLCEVSPGAISQWRTNGLPRTQRKFLMSARPELFPHAKKTRRVRSA